MGLFFSRRWLLNNLSLGTELTNRLKYYSISKGNKNQKMATKYQDLAYNSWYYGRVHSDSIDWLRIYKLIYKLSIYRKE